VARYEDGGAAITCRRAVGQACLMGVNLGDLAQRAMDGRAEPISRFYVNHYEPSLDVLARWVRDLYINAEPTPFLIDTAPPGRQVSIVLSHDIDYTRSVENSRAYAKLEHDAGVRATYFMQTKYVRDYNDDVFFTQKTIPELISLREAGMEIASHTVAHSRAFKRFPLGSGQERYTTYQPFVESKEATRDGTLFGETRVSKFLLEHFTGAHVTSFRPGHLSYPFNLPEVLEATGYTYSSSITANACLTHFPFQLTYARAGQSLAPVWEFPITIEDEEAPRLGDRIGAANDVVAKIAANHGLAMILIHPDMLGHKFAFERALITRWRDSAWITDLNTFGTWWRARDQANIDLIDDAGGQTLTIDAPLELNNLEIVFPKARTANARGQGYQLANGRLSIDEAHGQSRILIAATR
jgi:peptidoglycan/xylan/chitin deacetylase (PgdA/CDA1 family)